jgi:tetratricopeptide (TPR) repeat protein
MSGQSLATTLVSTQQMMGSVSQQPMLTLDFKTLGPAESRYFAELHENAPRLVHEAQPGDEQSLHRIGVACRLCGYFELAEMFYLKALELSTTTYGLNSLETSTHRNFLAGLYFVWQKYPSTQTLIESSLKVYQEKLGNQHIHTRLTHFALALIHTRLGDVTMAKKHFDLSGLKTLQFPEQAQAADRWQNLNFRLFALAAMKFEKQQYDESYELFRYCVITEANEAWPGSMVVAKSLNSLALLCRAQRLNSEAEEFFKMTLKMKEDIIGAEHSDYLNTQSQYQDLLRYMGKAVV